MIPKRGLVRAAVVLALGGLVVVPACAPLGAQGPGRGWGWEDGRIVGEVRSVDTRRDRIDVRVAHGGTRSVRYDRRTEFVARGHRISVHQLRRGDEVRIRLDHDRRGAPVAERVEVYRRDGWGDRRDDRRDDRWDDRRIERVSGTVRSVDHGRDYFVLESGRGRTLIIRVAERDLRGDDERRWKRLRRGDRVAVEVQYRSGNEVRLIRFR